MKGYHYFPLQKAATYCKQQHCCEWISESQTLLNHSGLFFLAIDNVVRNPASIPAVATEPRKNPPVKSLRKERLKQNKTKHVMSKRCTWVDSKPFKRHSKLCLK
jgi:hypothetical protein